MSGYTESLIGEQEQLVARIDRLKSFIESDKFDELPEVDRKDLRVQLTHMKAYCLVLARRVSRSCDNA